MLDLLYVAISILFFMLALAYVAACERLGKGSLQGRQTSMHRTLTPAFRAG